MIVNPSTLIRPATLVDLDAVMKLEKDSFTMPWSRDAVGVELGGDPRRMPLCLELEGEVIAFALVWVVADELHLVSMAVAEAHRNRGHARALLRHVFESPAGQSAAIMTLEVRRSNEAAIHLYRSYGFREIAIRTGYYPDNREDAIVMLKDLPGAGGEWPSHS